MEAVFRMCRRHMSLVTDTLCCEQMERRRRLDLESQRPSRHRERFQAPPRIQRARPRLPSRHDSRAIGHGLETVHVSLGGQRGGQSSVRWRSRMAERRWGSRIFKRSLRRVLNARRSATLSLSIGMTLRGTLVRPVRQKTALFGRSRGEADSDH